MSFPQAKNRCTCLDNTSLVHMVSVLETVGLSVNDLNSKLFALTHNTANYSYFIIFTSAA